ncbi:Hsp33 family molecular chaperone HslO [Lampropedia puyangensis]|uniref:Hsp33 family molecular chaperone HslO n=1 Tax=Lampropedia puyangensis TaxID=1330072 RepID=A0A4S8FCC3_9BURK|nr:Hsp33 family molecular chaperone HslO [Lampropedia puyangensis]THU05268.1 Hsp33 family molecular chaperone HslO [Lampropedia puyangensis]
MSEIQKFLFDGLPVRGAIVRVDTPWQEVLQRRGKNSETGPYPECISRILGQMTAAGLLMQSNIHFEGALVLQIQGDGPVRLAVAEIKSDLRLRATAQLAPSQKDNIATDASIESLFNVHGQGRCAITLDADEKRPGYQPYQGIVSLMDENGQTLPSLAAILQQYMQQSEQLDTVLVLAANDQVAAGLMIQRIPVKGEGNLAGAQHNTEEQDQLGHNEDFNRIATLASSLTEKELLELDTNTILRRLFWEETVSGVDTQGLMPHFGCQCDRERVTNMLRGLGQAEVTDMLEEEKPIEVGCEFCGAQYHFDAIDVAQIFAPHAAPASERIQ